MEFGRCGLFLDMILAVLVNVLVLGSLFAEGMPV